MNPSQEPQESQEPSPESDADAAAPVLLLVEDEPVSLAYLQAALTAFPARVLAAASAAEALHLAQATPCALWLIDAHLPDASGIELLQRLRAQAPAAVALAHTAEPSPALHARLRDAGFRAVLTKPIAMAALHEAVRVALAVSGADAAGAPDRHAAAGDAVRDGAQAAPAPAARPVWDDAAALRALNGNAALVAGMRSLFRSELAQTLPRIAALRDAGDDAALHGELHKLKAATAFVGAARLAEAVSRLAASRASADAGADGPGRAHADFVAAAEATLRTG